MKSEDNREIMDIDYETDIHCFRLMPHGKTLLALPNSQGMCKGCRFDSEKCVISQLLAKQQIDMFRLALKNNFDDIVDRILEEAKEEEEKDMYISDLELSVRSRNWLIRSGYTRLSEIIGLSYDDIAKIRNVGKKSADEIWQVIEKHRRDTK